jgi:3-isopropylmalate/(R)-2-methylmalate dehydratase small subunit
MQPFVVHRGVAAPLLRPNIDTDAIIPSREIRRVSKRGLGVGLFAGWRYSDEATRQPRPDFVLNKPEYAGCSIILAGDNFGCGSSREHAVWALAEYGIRCIVAPGFGGIFQGNCTRNGILPVILDATVIQTIASQVAADPQRLTLGIDLPAGKLTAPDGQEYGFELDAAAREMLIEGLDAVAMTMKLQASIEQFERARAARYPWLWRG